jgi:hypothetical protein
MAEPVRAGVAYPYPGAHRFARSELENLRRPTAIDSSTETVTSGPSAWRGALSSGRTTRYFRSSPGMSGRRRKDHASTGDGSSRGQTVIDQ